MHVIRVHRCFAGGGWAALAFSDRLMNGFEMIGSDEARRRILESVPVLDAEWVRYPEAVGRILRRSIIADRPLPPYDRVMMDGIAVNSGGGAPAGAAWALEGMAAAGEPLKRLRGRTGAIEVMTGAVLPEGCDTVIPVEWLDMENGCARLEPGKTVEPGKFIHREGSDFPRGAVLVEAGRAILAKDLAVAVSCGRTQLEVTRRARVALVSTGDELVDPDAVPESHQMRRSNSLALDALVRGCGLGETTLEHLPDDREVQEGELARLIEGHDVVVLSGGVSKGKKDFLPEVLRRLRVEEVFHRVAQRPGKPFWFGMHPGGVPVFGFPGNPLSTLVGGHVYLLPALRQLMGERVKAPETLPLGSSYDFSPPLTLFLPVVREIDPATGERRGLPHPVQNSGDYASVVETDGFLELPAERERFDAGIPYPFYPWE